MVWRMDMELQRPLMASEGNLDSVNGLAVFGLLQAMAKASGEKILEEEREGL